MAALAVVAVGSGKYRWELYITENLFCMIIPEGNGKALDYRNELSQNRKLNEK